jgi:hypothetical protein
MTPYYQDETVAIYHGDCREIIPDVFPEPGWGGGECVIIDPPWDQVELLRWVISSVSSDYESLLVFTDARRMRDPITLFGAPDWLFTWDTMNTWSRSAAQPVQQSKHALFYGKQYDRDAVLWGDAPPLRNHPTTKQTPLDGRRLTDVYRESIRWLHNETAGDAQKGSERFSTNRDHPMKHAKPIGWMRCLIGNTSLGPVVDPFCGSGSSLVAAKSIGRIAVGVDIDERCCEVAATRCSQGILNLGAA